MSDKKYSASISTEDLLKAISGQETEDFTSVDPYFAFIENFNIRPGPHKIQSRLLHALYGEWRPKNKGTSAEFNFHFGKYMEQHVKGGRYFYFINAEANDILKHIKNYKEPPKHTRVKGRGVQKHFKLFLESNGIKGGRLYIESDVFYHVYDTWCYRNKKRTLLSYRRFISICELFFEVKYFDGSYLPWFGLDASIKQHISPDAVRNWREGRHRRGKKSFVEKENQEIIYPETQKK